MSFNWIQLIGLLLVSSQIARNNAILHNINSHVKELRTKSIECEHGKSHKFQSENEIGNNQIQILIPSENATCKLLFSGHNDEEIQILLDDVPLSMSHINNSLPCGSLNFEEIDRTATSYFCPPSQQIDDLNHKLKTVYSSSSRNLTLTINSPKLDNSSILRIYYRFGSGSQQFSETVESEDLKEKQFICDHLFKQCNTPAQCIKLNKRPLNAPNFTCDYLIRSQNQSANNRITISQVNEQATIIYANTSVGCLNSVEFYDGQIANVEKLIIKLCLPIPRLPIVRSNSEELLVVYKLNRFNAKDQLELIAETESRKSRRTRVAERDKKSLPFDMESMESCNVYYNATTTSQRSGQIVFKNQLQDQPKDLPCFIHLSSSNPFDRIWFYFSSYRPASLLNTNSLSSNQFPPTDSCRIAELKLYDSSEQLTANNVNSLSNKGKSFCGTSQPRICNPNRQQCFLPSESYLSTGPKLSLMATNKINPSLYLLPLQYTLNYEMVNTQEYGEAVPGTICDRLFDSTRYRHGTVRSSRNLFLFGRGGRQNLNCGYIFRGQPNQRLRIQLYRIKVKSTDCVQQREVNSGANKCVFANVRSNGPSSRFSVWDVLTDVNSTSSTNDSNEIRIPVDCFCNKTVNFLTPISFHLIGGQATLNFTIENMRPTDDFNDFGFEAFYEFLSTSNDLSQHTPPFVQLEPARPVQVKTNPARNYTLTTYQLTVPSNYSFDYYQEFKQRKRLIANENESVLINVPNGFLWKNSALRTCSQLSRLVVYWIVPSSSIVDNNHAIATICIEPFRADQLGLDSLSTVNRLSTLVSDQMQLSFEFDHYNKLVQNTYLSDHLNNQLNQLLNTRTLRFYANRTVNRIDLVIELIATSKGQFRFDWLQSVGKRTDSDQASKFHSSMRTSEPNQSIKQFELNDKSDKSNDNLNNKSNKVNGSQDNSTQCMAYCPEDGVCLRQEYLCDQISHCTTSGFDESPLICEAKEQNRLEHFLSAIQTENGGKIDKITLNENLFKNNWFILLCSCIFLLSFALVAYLIIYLRRRSKQHRSIASNNYPSAHLQIGGCNSIHTGTLQTGSASSTFSGNSSLTNSSCTNSMLCEKRLKKLKQKITNKEHSKHVKQSANALTLMRTNFEDNNFNPLISSFANNSTTIHQQINANQPPADYMSTSEFQFELNQDRLNNYDLDKQPNDDFSPLYKKMDADEYSLKQHIYYQPAYTTLQRNNRLDNSRAIQEKQRLDSHLDYRLDQRMVDKPPLPPLPLVLQNAQPTQQPSSLLAYHSTANNGNESHHETFGLRTQLNTSHLTNLNNHTIARQSLLADQAERLLMSTPIYDRVVDRQQFNNNNASSMHHSTLFASSRFANRRFS